MNKNLLCLKWDEFDTFVLNGLSNLYQKDDMSDTTLFCDGRSFKTHKVILSMWSGYFREIFGTTSQTNPVIVLRETASSDLELILRFMYQGQLFVPFEDTERFLKTAEYFQIAGLKEMRVHLSPERNGGGASSSSGKDPSGITIHSSPNSFVGSNNGSGSVPVGISSQSSSSQSYVSPSTSSSYAFQGVTTASVDGIPVQILNNSSVSPGHSNAINTVSIVTSNSSNNSSVSGGTTHFSSNVIKPIPNRQQPCGSGNSVNRLVPSSSNSGSTVALPPSPYGHHLPNHHYSRPGQEIAYSNQPILIVQKQNEYHENGKSVGDSRSSDQVLVFERVTNGAAERKILSVDPGMNHDNSANNYGQIHQEEVLGLAYLQENHSSRSSTHSQIIQEAAVAAGVEPEDSDMMEINHRDSLGVNEDSNSRHSKPTCSLVLSSSPPPVYAVKRLPSTASSSTSHESTPCDIKAFKTSGPGSAKGMRKTKSMSKSQRKGPSSTESNGDVELVNCPKCHKAVKKSSLKVHIKRTHLEEGTVLICPICSKHLSSKGVYYKHMYQHRQTGTKQNNTPVSSSASGKSSRPTTSLHDAAQQSKNKESRP